MKYNGIELFYDGAKERTNELEGVPQEITQNVAQRSRKMKKSKA